MQGRPLGKMRPQAFTGRRMEKTFEEGFAQAEDSAAAAVKAAQALVTAARNLKKHAKDGNISKMRDAASRLSTSGDAASQQAENAAAAWPFDAEEEADYLRGDYEQELIEAGHAEGLRIHVQDDVLVVFPKIVRILPDRRAVRVDRKQVPTIRPSKLVATLRSEQQKRLPFSSEQFLEALYKAYRQLTGEGLFGSGKDLRGTPVLLTKAYESLTLLPGSRRDYSRTDFCRDLYQLDQSGIRQTRSGAAFAFQASSGTRQSQRLSFVGPDGAAVTYYSISFKVGGQ